MMFVYKWNNFLHSLLADIITNSINSDLKMIDIEFENQMVVDEVAKPEKSPTNEGPYEKIEVDKKSNEESQSGKIGEFMDVTSFIKFVNIYLKMF